MKRAAFPTALVLLTPFAAVAQTAAFEVASVKLDVLPPGTFYFGFATSVARIQISGNRVALKGTLGGLVAAAFDVKAYQISGAPVWKDPRNNDAVFQVDARTPGDAAPPIEQVRQCLRALLADRFQLKLHRDTAVLPVYELVVGKNGPKLKESAGDAESRASGGPGGVFRLRAYNRSMADLIAVLSGSLDRPVIDKTGLAGHYDFDLEYVRGNPDAADGADDRSIFTAVQQQLGLKLVPANQPFPIVVIDHAERPSAN